MDEYNYRNFPKDLCLDDFNAFPTICRVGTTAPDGELVSATTGAREKLSDYWRRGLLVIEFGSFT